MSAGETEITLETGSEVLVRVTEPDVSTDDATVIVVFPGGAYELAWRDALCLADALNIAGEHGRRFD